MKGPLICAVIWCALPIHAALPADAPPSTDGIQTHPALVFPYATGDEAFLFSMESAQCASPDNPDFVWHLSFSVQNNTGEDALFSYGYPRAVSLYFFSLDGKYLGEEYKGWREPEEQQRKWGIYLMATCYIHKGKKVKLVGDVYSKKMGRLLEAGPVIVFALLRPIYQPVALVSAPVIIDRSSGMGLGTEPNPPIKDTTVWMDQADSHRRGDYMETHREGGTEIRFPSLDGLFTYPEEGIPLQRLPWP